MPDYIEIKVEDKEVLGILKKLSDKLKDMRPVMKNIVSIMMDSVEENFEQEGRPKWPALKKSTIKAKEKKGYWPGKILQMRGELASSITSSYDSKSAVVGTNKVYAAIHQFGHKKKNIPARPYLNLGDDDLKEIKNSLIIWIK